MWKFQSNVVRVACGWRTLLRTIKLPNIGGPCSRLCRLGRGPQMDARAVEPRVVDQVEPRGMEPGAASPGPPGDRPPCAVRLVAAPDIQAAAEHVAVVRNHVADLLQPQRRAARRVVLVAVPVAFGKELPDHVFARRVRHHAPRPIQLQRVRRVVDHVPELAQAAAGGDQHYLVSCASAASIVAHVGQRGGRHGCGMAEILPAAAVHEERLFELE